MAPGNEVICVLLLVVLLDVECMLISRFGGHQFYRRDEPEPESHPFEVIDGACEDGSSRKAYMEVMKQSTCSRPLDAVVKLVSEDDNYEYLPSHVRVKRCSGSCSAVHSCLPNKTKTVQVMVRLLSRVTNNYECGTVEVEEHISCKCDCSVMEKHCDTKLQVYKPKDCMCECKNVEEKDKCLMEGNLWNTKKCRCECDQKECSTGMEWVPSHCRCMRVVY